MPGVPARTCTPPPQRHPARQAAGTGRSAEPDQRDAGGAGRPPRRHHRAQPHQRRGRAAEQLRPLPAGAGGGADARCAAHPRGVCPHRPLADGHHGAQWHQLAAGPRAHGALSGLRGAGGQRLRRRADLVHGPAGGGGVYRRQHRAAHRQLRRGRLDAVRAVAPVDPAGRGRRQYLRVQRHAAEAQPACSTTRAAMRPRR